MRQCGLLNTSTKKLKKELKNICDKAKEIKDNKKNIKALINL